MEEGKKYDKPQYSENIAVTESEIHAAKPYLRGRALTAALAFVAGTGFTLFGYAIKLLAYDWTLLSNLRSYDQGVMSALLTAGQVRTLSQTHNFH